MEFLAIFILLAGGAVAAPLYCWALVTFVRPFPLFAQVGARIAWVLVIVAMVEMAAVLVFGPVAARGAVGPAFLWLHAMLTFPLPAMLCAALLLSGRIRASRWFAVALAGWLLGVGVLYLHYHVTESLDGVDGIGGPYSEHGTQRI